jgi:hypothetical protein
MKMTTKGLQSLNPSSLLAHLIVITPNHIPRLGNILIPIDPLPLGGSTKFFKLECNGEFKGDKVIKVKNLRFATCVLSWRLYCNRKGILNWAYVGSNEIKS